MYFGEQKKDGGKKIGLASYIISLKEKKQQRPCVLCDKKKFYISLIKK